MNEIEIEGIKYQMRLATQNEIPQLILNFPKLNEVAASVFVLSRFCDGKWVDVGTMEGESFMYIRQVWLKQKEGVKIRTHFTAFALFLQGMAKQSGATFCGFISLKNRMIQRVFESLGAKKNKRTEGRIYTYPNKFA